MQESLYHPCCEEKVSPVDHSDLLKSLLLQIESLLLQLHRAEPEKLVS